jgi:hypothetical protein
MEQVVNVSPSVLADVLTCETKAWTRHVKGYTSRGDAIKAVAGQAIHAGIARYLSDPEGVCNDVRALGVFHDVYDPAHARLTADQLDPAYTPANLHRVLARWLETHPPSALPWTRVLSVEEAFCSREWVTGDTRVRLIVRPDAVVEDANGRVRFVDTKTTGWRISDSSWRRALRLSLQLALYTDAVMQRYGDRAVCGGWINAIEIAKLPSDPTRKCTTHHVVYAECGNEHAKQEIIECMTTPERVARALADAHNAAEMFVRMQDDADASACDMAGGANGACRFCAAGEWCEAGRAANALESFMIHDPWVVEEGAR